MTDETKTDAKPKAPPAWRKRASLDRMAAANALGEILADRTNQANRATDLNVAAGLRDQCRRIARAIDSLAAARKDSALAHQCKASAKDWLGVASATTGDEAARKAAMDTSHAFSEAARHLS